MDDIYSRLEDKSVFGEDVTGCSEIQQFFNGQTVFLTGCTGFVGKIFVEKLLRSCYGIKKLYVLVRPKKFSIEERIKQYFDNAIFDRLKEERPNFRSKVSIIIGNLSEDNIGLAKEDRARLIEETSLIYHNASNVKFDENMSVALGVNVIGTKNMLDLAMECKNLLAFVYISTAYSHCYRQHIEEKFYPPPGDMKMMMDIKATDESTPGGLSEEALKRVRGKWPNNYVFTKSTAEGLIEQFAKQAPFSCSVFRPSMVISTYLEPIRGWCGNINGPIGGIVGNAIGFIHVVYKGHLPLDCIPADMCANAIIAVTWDSVKNKKSEKEGSVYNYGTSTANRMCLREFQEKCYIRGCETPSIHMVGPYYTTYTNCVWHYWTVHLFVHLFTALFADCFLVCTGQKPQVLSYWKLMTKNIKSLIYFSSGNWRIHVHRMQEVWDRMNPRDKNLFFCDLRKLDWDEYTYAYWAGLRVYILRDPITTVPIAVKKFNTIMTVHKFLSIAVRFLIIFFVARWLILTIFANFY